ncbi:hypothetical protein CKAH01_06259 [Colletotrichum kahawae]|uniref:F-box domain-containing protein n=1 Tax=Colletotrichum kahawae TaxID=34407 RepID=A0AAD9Y8U3_COLKA|nr:hypothetical protein CKAH01_06259 [Colletotrichum kahawae]
MDQLPLELMDRILDPLAVRDLFAIKRTCRGFSRIPMDNIYRLAVEEDLLLVLRGPWEYIFMKDTSITPHILRAAAVGNLSVLRELVNHGADLGMYLTPSGQNECVEYLLSFKRVADDIDRGGFYCCMCPFIGHPASESLMTSRWSSSLSLALTHQHTETALILIKNGANWNASIDRKLPPIYHMVAIGATALIQYISELRQENQQYWSLSWHQKWTLLQFASHFKGEREEIKQLVRALINAGENLDTPAARFNKHTLRSSLHFAIMAKNIRLATVLLEAGSYAGMDCDTEAAYGYWQYGVYYATAPIPPECEMWPLALFNFMCDKEAERGRTRPIGVCAEDYSRWGKGYRDTKECRLKMEKFWGIPMEELDYFRTLIEARVRI